MCAHGDAPPAAQQTSADRGKTPSADGLGPSGWLVNAVSA